MEILSVPIAQETSRLCHQMLNTWHFGIKILLSVVALGMTTTAEEAFTAINTLFSFFVEYTRAWTQRLSPTGVLSRLKRAIFLETVDSVPQPLRLGIIV